MDTDQRVRLAHHLISTSIFKKLLAQFSGSLQLYRTEHAPSTLLQQLSNYYFADESPATTAFHQFSGASRWGTHVTRSKTELQPLNYHRLNGLNGSKPIKKRIKRRIYWETLILKKFTMFRS